MAAAHELELRGLGAPRAGQAFGTRTLGCHQGQQDEAGDRPSGDRVSIAGRPAEDDLHPCFKEVTKEAVKTMPVGVTRVGERAPRHEHPGCHVRG